MTVRTCSALANLHPQQSPQTTSRGLADRGKLWRPGQILTVGFLDGAPALRQKVFRAAQEWAAYANIKFQLVATPHLTKNLKSTIRITFVSGGSWSYVGTDALGIQAGQPTMQLGWLTENSQDSEIRRVTLHEFGHALGLLHEHQHPEGGIHWDREQVIAHYKRTNGWSAAQTELNVLAGVSGSQFLASAFDPQSIMLYPIPAELTTDGYSTQWNYMLSDGDKALAAQLYPKRQATYR